MREARSAGGWQWRDRERAHSMARFWYVAGIIKLVSTATATDESSSPIVAPRNDEKRPSFDFGTMSP